MERVRANHQYAHLKLILILSRVHSLCHKIQVLARSSGRGRGRASGGGGRASSGAKGGRGSGRGSGSGRGPKVPELSVLAAITAVKKLCGHPDLVRAVALFSFFFTFSLF